MKIIRVKNFFFNLTNYFLEKIVIKCQEMETEMLEYDQELKNLDENIPNQ